MESDTNSSLDEPQLESLSKIEIDESKKFVSQAVAFVVKHAQKGIVSLCASIAELLQEKDRLENEVKILQEEIKKCSGQSSDQSGYKVIKGCICELCTPVKEDATVLVAPLQPGQQVIIRGEISGTVRYVGHLKLGDMTDVYAGLELHVPIGDNNGTVNGKEFFKCPAQYGLFVPLQSILCVIK